MFWCIVPVGRGSVECRRSISSGESLSHAVNPCQSSGVRKSTPGLLSVDRAGLSGKLPGAPATAWGPVSVETPPIQCRLGAESFAAMPLAATTFTLDAAVGAFRAVATPAAAPALLASRVFSSKFKLRAPLSSLQNTVVKWITQTGCAGALCECAHLATAASSSSMAPLTSNSGSKAWHKLCARRYAVCWLWNGVGDSGGSLRHEHGPHPPCAC